MGQYDGKVVYITGIARGQGRAHAIAFASEGAKIIGCDINSAASEYVTYENATEDDFAETVRLVEQAGGEILARKVDVRDLAGQEALVAEGVKKFGDRLDVVIANAGICNWGKFWEIDEQQWQDTLDVNLTGVWKTLKACAPHMIKAGNGGSITVISSVAGLKAMPVQAPYSASKYGATGLTQTAAKELGEFRIRVNSVHPYGVNTPMAMGDPKALEVFEQMPQFVPHFTPILQGAGPVVECEDVSKFLLYLASDDAWFYTGAQIPLDMGNTKV